MKNFMGKNFLLESKTAKLLYHQYAKDLPIIDYHCHVSPQEIATDYRFNTITKAWLGGDHYKWRLLRCHGVGEDYITGNAPDKEKFYEYAKTLPHAIGNPLYHWTHLELKRYFDYHKPLSQDTMQEVWELCNKKLAGSSLSVKNIIRNSNVELIGTTDDPIDTLEYHKQISIDRDFTTKVIPTFRPDRAVNIDKAGFVGYIESLSQASGVAITNLDTLKQALTIRIEYFVSHGCRSADLGLDYAIYTPSDDVRVDESLKLALEGGSPSVKQVSAYKTHILLYLAREFSRVKWVMQIHYGAMRNVNAKMFHRIGADTGFDCISGASCAKALADFLSALDFTDELPKTIIYSLNPNDNAILASIIGAFQGEGVRGKVMHGSAWWFNDTKTGMVDQLTNLANISILGNFVGMLTDSRSFLSYTRHEYFRRILCNLIGGLVENGEYHNDLPTLKRIVQNICYYNAKELFC